MNPSVPCWLPSLFEHDGGDWDTYVRQLYALFTADILSSGLKLANKPCTVPRDKANDGREETFWHCISSKDGEDRVPDFRRCERLSWIKALIEAVDKGEALAWRNRRGSRKRVVVSLPDFSYVVVLGEHNTRLVLITHYEVEQPHRRTKLRKEYEAAEKI